MVDIIIMSTIICTQRMLIGPIKGEMLNYTIFLDPFYSSTQKVTSDARVFEPRCGAAPHSVRGLDAYKTICILPQNLWDPNFIQGNSIINPG